MTIQSQTIVEYGKPFIALTDIHTLTDVAQQMKKGTSDDDNVNLKPEIC